MLDRATDTGVLTGTRDFQPDPKLNVSYHLQTTCADNRNGTSIVFVTAEREDSQLQKMKQSTSLGIGPATITMPSGSAKVLGIVRRETIQDPDFYHRQPVTRPQPAPQPVMAQNPAPNSDNPNALRSDIRGDEQDMARDRADIRADRRDIRSDVADVRSDRMQLRQDFRAQGVVPLLLVVTPRGVTAIACPEPWVPCRLSFELFQPAGVSLRRGRQSAAVAGSRSQRSDLEAAQRLHTPA